MSAEAKAKKLDSPSNPHYKGPPVELGQIVLWFPQGSPRVEPAAAIVTQVGNENVCLNLLMRELKDMPLRDGVFHISDPRSRKEDTLENGAWDYTPAWKRMMKLEASMNELSGVELATV